MKKLILTIPLTALVIFSLITFNACDKFENLPLNIPIVFKFAITNANPVSTEDVCMDQSSSFQEYRDKFKNLSLVEAVFRITTVVPADVQGTIVIEVWRTDTNQLLMTRSYPNIKPADYLPDNVPLNLQLTQAEIDLVNAYLDANPNACFRAIISGSNVTPTGSNFDIKGVVDILFYGEAEL